MENDRSISLCSICSVDLKCCPYFMKSTYNNPHFIPGQEYEVVVAPDKRGGKYDLYVTKKCPLFVPEEKYNGHLLQSEIRKIMLNSSRLEGDADELPHLKCKLQEEWGRLQEEKQKRSEERRALEEEKHIKKKERDLMVYQLRLSGLSGNEIAKRFGISRKTVFNIIWKVKEDIQK